jgi:hypothetical protein
MTLQTDAGTITAVREGLKIIVGGRLSKVEVGASLGLTEAAPREQFQNYQSKRKVPD